jgi:hypothetical protein
VCDYCGCRRFPLLERLGEEHEVLWSLVGDLRRALSSPGDVEPAAGRLISALDDHLVLEDGRLRPVLMTDPLLSTTVPSWDAEHQRIAELCEPAADPHLRTAQLAELCDLLERHLHREEFDLFPAASQLLDEQAARGTTDDDSPGT